jgi:hypothetical protein
MGDNQKYVLISYASKDKKYLKYAHQFKKNLKSLGIVNYDITYLDIPKDLNYWKDEYKKDKIKKELICLQKPTLILNKLNLYKMPIICVDIDSKLIKKPILPNEYFDNCFIFRKNRKLLSVTNGFHVHNYTENSIRFLKIWEYLCQNPELTYLSDHWRLKISLDLIKQENENNMLKKISYFKKTIILDGINLYNNTYIEGFTRLNDNIKYFDLFNHKIDSSINSIDKSNLSKKKILKKSNPCVPMGFPMGTILPSNKPIKINKIKKPKR